MRSLAALAVAATLGLSTMGASAMPFDAGLGQNDGLVTQVRDGCGPGRFRGPHGRCHPMAGWGYGHRCGRPGWRFDRWGRCRRW